MTTAISIDDMGMLEWWLQNYTLPDRCDVNSKIFKYAVEIGHLQVLQWLQAQGRLSTSSSDIQIVCKHLHIAQWIHENAPDLPIAVKPKASFDFIKWAREHENQYEIKEKSFLINKAVILGNMDLIQSLHKDWLERCSVDALFRAVERGHFDIADWLYETYTPQFFRDPKKAYIDCNALEWITTKYEWLDTCKRTKWIDSCIELADSAGVFESVTKLLFERGYKDQGEAMRIAAWRGKFEMVKWLHDHQAIATKEAMDCAAESGCLEVLKWLHYNRTEGCTKQAMNEAARRNYLDVVQWLSGNRSEGCTTDAMDKAASNGFLEMVQWLHFNRTEGCTTAAMDKAIFSGYMNIAKWLHEFRAEGCTEIAVNATAARGELGIIKWLDENRLEGFTANAMYEASSVGNLQMVKWLHENRSEGCTTKAMDVAAENGYLEIVKFLHEHRSEGCTTKAMDSAAENGHWDVVTFLHEYRCEGCTTDAMDNAAGKGDTNIIRYLHEHRQEGGTTKTMDRIATWWEDWEFVKWLVRNRQEDGTAVSVLRACRRGNFEMVKFLTLEGRIYCESKQLEQMTNYYHRYDMVEWLLKEYHALSHIVDSNRFID